MNRPKVLLLGDSISLGYRSIVKCNLKDSCKVIYPKEQGKFASDIYRMLYEWNKYLPIGNDIDFVYWNAGLWDVVRIYGEECQTDIECYKAYLYRIYLRLRKLFPNSIICFASTTPVIESRYTKDFCRYNEDIIAYNAAAYEVLYGKVDVYDDLFSYCVEIPEVLYKDATHFMQPVNIKLASHICDLINKLLGNEIEMIKEINTNEKEKTKNMLSSIFEENKKVAVAAWGAGNIFRDYKDFISIFCNLKAIVDKDKRLQGSKMDEINCISPEELSNDISLVIITINNIDAQNDVSEYCRNKKIVSCTYEEFLNYAWPKYEENILRSTKDIKMIDHDPNAVEEMQKYIGLTIPENICNLDCVYCYLSVNPNRRFENIGRKNPHLPLFIRRQLRRDVLGGSCLIGLTGSGETLLADKFSDVCTELLKEGHYLHIVTNGTPVDKIKEVIDQAGIYAKHIIFKLSFHYLQLVKKGLLNNFVESVKFIEQSEASLTIEIMPHDELIPYIPEVLKFSKENFGALPHLTIGRNENDNMKLLTNQSFAEYYDTWKIFDSSMFNMRMKLYYTKGSNCKAGPLSFFVDLYTGRIDRCVFYENIGNLYLDGIQNTRLDEVGDSCPLNSCYNCHIYAPLGILPMKDVPTYYTIRDRIKEDGTHWIKEDMRRFLDIKL